MKNRKFTFVITVFFFSVLTQANDDNYLSQLPPELRQLIISRLDTKAIIATCTTSSKMKKLCDENDGPLWASIVMRDFNNYFGNPSQTSWQNIYATLMSKAPVSFTCPSNESLSQALINAEDNGKKLKTIGSGPKFSIEYYTKLAPGSLNQPTTKKYKKGQVAFSEVVQSRRHGHIDCRYSQDGEIVVAAIFNFLPPEDFISPEYAPCHLEGREAFPSNNVIKGDDPSKINIICTGEGKGVHRRK